MARLALIITYLKWPDAKSSTSFLKNDRWQILSILFANMFTLREIKIYLFFQKKIEISLIKYGERYDKWRKVHHNYFMKPRHLTVNDFQLY